MEKAEKAEKTTAKVEATKELKEETSRSAVLVPVVEILRVSLLGIQTTDKPTAVSNATSPQARAAVPKIRTRGTTYNSFQNLQKDMEKVSFVLREKIIYIIFDDV